MHSGVSACDYPQLLLKFCLLFSEKIPDHCHHCASLLSPFSVRLLHTAVELLVVLLVPILPRNLTIHLDGRRKQALGTAQTWQPPREPRSTL